MNQQLLTPTNLVGLLATPWLAAPLVVALLSLSMSMDANASRVYLCQQDKQAPLYSGTPCLTDSSPRQNLPPQAQMKCQQRRDALNSLTKPIPGDQHAYLPDAQHQAQIEAKIRLLPVVAG